ncbi:MAG: 50S ribosomal protein L32 [Deltaproteobacteria bacterium]|nr:50S ribosomal protein L32 [Deltaproteobacteria bacterium]
MAVPKHRKSKSRKNMRRSHDKLSSPSLSLCAQCAEPKMPHRACPSCGTYRGRTYIETED